MGGVGECADTGKMDVVGGNTAIYELQAVALRQVDVPSLFTLHLTGNRDVHQRETACYLLHGELCLGKGIIYLITHLERLQRNAGTYGSTQRFGASGIATGHCVHRRLYYSPHCTTPSSMHGSSAMMLGVIKKNGYAVGSGDTDADTCHVGYHGIDTFNVRLALFLLKTEILRGNKAELTTVRLMWIDETVGSDAQPFSKYGKVLRNVLLRVAAVVIDIE